MGKRRGKAIHKKTLTLNTRTTERHLKLGEFHCGAQFNLVENPVKDWVGGRAALLRHDREGPAGIGQARNREGRRPAEARPVGAGDRVVQRADEVVGHDHLAVDGHPVARLGRMHRHLVGLDLVEVGGGAVDEVLRSLGVAAEDGQARGADVAQGVEAVLRQLEALARGAGAAGLDDLVRPGGETRWVLAQAVAAFRVRIPPWENPATAIRPGSTSGRLDKNCKAPNT